MNRYLRRMEGLQMLAGLERALGVNHKKEVYVHVPTEYPIVKIAHKRRKLLGKTHPNGGVTIIQLEVRKGVFYAGAAYCWERETYNKVKGKSIALGRLLFALSALEYPDYAETKEWLMSKVGRVDETAMLDAFLDTIPK